MNDQPKPEFLSRNVLLLLLAICLVAVAAVVVLVLRPDEREQEKIISVIEDAAPQEAGVNVLQVEDAMTSPDLVAAEGHRYKVLIVDNAREGASGIARIGGLVTFVPDTVKGDVAVIEVTELKRTTASAVLVEKLESGHAVPGRSADRAPRDDSPRTETSELVGNVYRGTVEGVGDKGDGVVRVKKKVVFVPGVATGDYIEFKVVADVGRFASGELISRLDKSLASTAPAETPASESATPPAKTDKHGPAPVAVGEEHTVTITEADRTNPDKDGVTRIERFVIFVPGTQPGDHVRIRIAEVRPRSATAEVIERLAAEPAAP